MTIVIIILFFAIREDKDSLSSGGLRQLNNKLNMIF